MYSIKIAFRSFFSRVVSRAGEVLMQFSLESSEPFVFKDRLTDSKYIGGFSCLN